MKKLDKIIIVLITLLLSACGSRPPSEADGWRLADNEVDVYVRETIYTMADDKMTEYLEVHEGTWTASEDPEVAIIIENGSIFVGLHSGFNVYPVSSYELEEMQYTSKENDYKPGRPAYTLSLKVPDFFARYVDEMSTFYTFLDESIYSDDNYGFIFTAGTDGKIASYSMERSNHQYSITDNRINQQDVYEEEKSEKIESEHSEGYYTDGTYHATVDGHNGPLTAEVTIIDGTIAKVNVIDHEETRGLADPAIEEVPDAIVKNNSTNVDTVSGATVTSEAIIEAAIEAKKQAESNPMHESAGSGPKESPQELSLKSMRDLAKEYVDEWNGYDNTLLEEDWTDDGVWRYYMFQDGPTQHMVGVIVHSETGEVRGDYGGID